MESTTLPQLAELEALRGNPVVFYSSAITGDSVRILYECLRRRGRTGRLDLVLSTRGGSVTTVRQVALLLREYVRHLTILVPYRARSAGTLLCLGANELVLGPMAELGPIDSHIGSASPPPPDAPGMISAEAIRAFPEMAEDWFGVKREEDRLQVLALLAQRVFPTSLSSFYRFDKLVRKVADELLKYQLPRTDASTRERIVDQLVGGYFAHDYVISLSEARELGLRVRGASPQEEVLLWDLVEACRDRTAEHSGQEQREAVGMIASTEFSARQVLRRAGAPIQQRNGSRHKDAPQQRGRKRLGWLIPERGGLRREDPSQPGDRSGVYWEIDR